MPPAPPEFAPVAFPDPAPAQNPPNFLPPAPVGPAAIPLPPGYPPAKTKSALPFVLIVLGILALLTLVGIGGVVYVGYLVKQKVTSVAQQVKERTAGAEVAKNPPPGQTPAPSTTPDASALLNGLSGLLGGGGDDDGDPVESISLNDPVPPCSAAPYPTQSGARIPLQAGTAISTAWGMLHGDVENRISVDATGPTSLTLSVPPSKWIDDQNVDRKSNASTHTICNEDYQVANTYATVLGNHQPHTIHGLIRLRLSAKSFQKIKSTGKTYLIYYDIMEDGDNSGKPIREGGLLSRVEPQDIPYPLIVNDERVTLPAIHLSGVLASIGKDPTPKKNRHLHTQTDVYLIDDPVDPLVLLYKANDPAFHDDKFRIEVIKIDYPVAHPVNLVEKQLAETKKAVTWGIYFDFNKDTIKPESAPVLKEIAQAMANNPDWKLTVTGNTDNIGGDTYNLDLSKRRAAAVKAALVSQYHIGPDRLSTDGYGASHPIDTNDTLEGRARNRRVELTRE